MNLRNAVVRSVRTAAQALAAGLGTIGIASVADLPIAGELALVMVVNAGLAGLISLLQNISEDASGVSVPKG